MSAPGTNLTQRVARVGLQFSQWIGLEGTLIGAADRLRLHRTERGRVGFPYVVRRRKQCFQILSYHRVNDAPARYFPGIPVDCFRRQMESLARRAAVLPLGELVDRMTAGDVPPRSVALTFDDGYRDNYEQAFPVLRRLGLPATVFLATGVIDTGAVLWHDRVFDAFEWADRPTLECSGRTFPMSPPEARDQTLREVLSLLRSEGSEQRNALIEDIERQLRGAATRSRGDRMLSWRQIEEMAGCGITFGAHTVSHPILTRIPPAEAVGEIRACRAAIQSRLGRTVDQFAYPNGTREDFDETIQGILEAEGFRCAVTTLWGVNDAGSSRFELRRIGVWTTDPDLVPLRLAWYRFSD